MKKTFYPQPGPLRALADAWQCRRTVRALFLQDIFFMNPFNPEKQNIFPIKKII